MHPPSRPVPTSQRGFTLVELMIALVVVAILASIAYPSFMGAIRKSRRAEAISALNQVQQAQERFRANQTAYTTNLSAAPTATPPGLGLSSTTASGYYTIAIASASNDEYELTATAVAGTSQAMDGDCAMLGARMKSGSIEYAGGPLAGTFTNASYASSHPCWAR
ncbi:MAG TPA: type IV pilin protein [Rubrivivax sp.]|nr:type IV pilin protein [Burkholderiales bacterium]HNT38813.1 type IV pilin protein [Rubrivivax sp.]